MANKNSFSYKLTAEQQDILDGILRTGNYRPIRVEHTRIAVEIPHCKISLYKSGTCLVQGKGAEEFVTFTLEPLVLMGAEIGVRNRRATESDFEACAEISLARLTTSWRTAR